ncbi:MAG: adenylyltransferase/cytidyltransferase family protein [Pirellulaceae bacterium]
MNEIRILGSFDNLKLRHVRLLQEAARLGPVHVLLLSDLAVEELTGSRPAFPQEERRYFLQAVRYVDRLTLVQHLEGREALPECCARGPATWAVEQAEDHADRRTFCAAHGLAYVVIQEDSLAGIPLATPVRSAASLAGRKKVVVTGCYDWLHTGHVRFFEEVSELGALHVVVGHDANIQALKGAGHPLYGQDERRYMVGAIRCVQEASIATGDGWLDAESEIQRIQPDIYAVNEDGDRPEKREYCRAHGIDYRVLKRLPKAGLPRRQSTDLRGF